MLLHANFHFQKCQSQTRLAAHECLSAHLPTEHTTSNQQHDIQPLLIDGVDAFWSCGVLERLAGVEDEDTPTLCVYCNDMNYTLCILPTYPNRLAHRSIMHRHEACMSILSILTFTASTPLKNLHTSISLDLIQKFFPLPTIISPQLRIFFLEP